MRRSTFIAILMFSVIPSVGRADDNGPTADQQAFTEMQAKIDALDQSRNLPGLEKIADEIQTQWIDKDATSYGELMLKVANILRSRAFNRVHPFAESRSTALLALKRKDLPVYLQTELVAYVSLASSNVPDLSTLRKEDMVQLLIVWKNVNNQIDPNWDPVKDYPPVVKSPVGEPVDGGYSPDRIPDPVQRAKYIADVAARIQATYRYDQQQGARDLAKKFADEIQSRMVSEYSFGPANLEELKAFLDQSPADAEMKQRIIEKVRASLEDQGLVPVTQPSSRP